MKVLYSKVFAIIMVLIMLLGLVMSYPLEANAAEQSSLDNWTSSSLLPTGITLRSVVHINDMFMAVGSNGAILSSTDGMKWQVHRFDTEACLNSIAYGNGNFVVVGWWGTILTSTDGIKWQDHSIDIEGYLNGVTYGNGKFVAVGDYGTILTSVDGTKWQLQYPDTEIHLDSVIYGNDKFVTVGLGGTVLTSTDGTTWRKQTSVTNAYLYEVAYGNGKFVAAGYYYDENYEEHNTILKSIDGMKWQEQTITDASGLHGISYGNEKFMAVDYLGTILSSEDGMTWRTHKSGTSNELNDVEYGNGVYVAVGNNGTILASADQPKASSTTQESSGSLAVPTSSKVLINGREVSFEAYNINGNNYFKLRDIATVMNGTEKQFEVCYDNVEKAVAITSDKAYTAIGGEGAKGDGLEKTAIKSFSTISYDNSFTNWECYNINGYNYTKLRDIGETMNFGITWNTRLKTIEINTKAEYTE